MYNVRQNLIRAVRVLPEAVRVGEDNRGGRQEHEDNEKEQTEAERELGAARDRIKSLQSQVELLNNKLSEALASYDKLAGRCDKLENELANREDELKREMQMKLDTARAEVITAAEKDAAAIRADAESIRASAADKGHAEGLDKGNKEGLVKARAAVDDEYRTRFADIIAFFENTQHKLEGNFSELANLNEARLLRLWQKVLSTMLNRDVELDPDTARRVLSGVLERVSDKNKLLIYLSPSDVEAVQSSTETLTDQLRGAKHIEFLPDPRVDKGSCIVETNLGIYDARWRTQMEQIESQIADLYRESAKDAADMEQKAKQIPEATEPQGAKSKGAKSK